MYIKTVLIECVLTSIKYIEITAVILSFLTGAHIYFTVSLVHEVKK